jgi:hypothetical protein
VSSALLDWTCDLCEVVLAISSKIEGDDHRPGYLATLPVFDSRKRNDHHICRPDHCDDTDARSMGMVGGKAVDTG